mmetsp:Transcript_15305/g.42464  ORF Transcript_15305/g.42464 Transcript_15305/m.42464 type:complete len:200 (-) Transcript_15305:170-769(-)
METCQQTRDKLSFSRVLVEADRYRLFHNIRVVFFALQFIYRTNDLIRVAGVKVLFQVLMDLQFEFRQSEHRSVDNPSLVWIVMTRFGVLGASQNVFSLSFVIKWIVLVEWLYLVVVNNVLLPFSLPVPSLLFVARIEVALGLFALNVPLSCPFLCLCSMLFVNRDGGRDAGVFLCGRWILAICSILFVVDPFGLGLDLS